MSFHGFQLFFLFHLLNINLIHFFVLLLILIIHKRVELISHFHFLKELFHCLILQVYLGDLNYLIFLDYRFLIEVSRLSSLFKYPIVIFNNHLFHFIFTVLINHQVFSIILFILILIFRFIPLFVILIMIQIILSYLFFINFMPILLILANILILFNFLSKLYY